MAKGFKTTANLPMAQVCDMMVMPDSQGIRHVMRVVARTALRGRKGTTLLTLENVRTNDQLVIDLVRGENLPTLEKAFKTDMEAFWNGMEAVQVVSATEDATPTV